MILIGESGSTKTNWLTEKNELFQTIGFNPLFHTSESIYNELMKHEELLKVRDNFDKIFFYGASCSTEERKNIVRIALKKYFTQAKVVGVDHDLKAAAIATFDGRKAITCILGTGSNSCRYDGNIMEEEVPALGYALGDEGSGAYFGKKLAALFLYRQLPEQTHKLLKEKYGAEKEVIIDNVYRKPFPNVYLAKFAKVLSDSPNKEFINELVENGFDEFFKYHVCCFDNYKNYPIHFVGSIAFFFQDALRKVVESYGCVLGNVNREPVYKLLEWHMKEEARTA
jgi:glucosamine kinase